MEENWKQNDNSSNDFNIEHYVDLTVNDFKETLLTLAKSDLRGGYDDELVSELLMMEDSYDAFDYMENHPYWGRLWSIHLLYVIHKLTTTGSLNEE